MTLFGENLKKVIDDNDLNIYRLTQQAGIERTTIHKIISGSRIPDADYVRKLISALPVSPFEKDELLSAYDISRDGEFLYNQRIQVRQLIERISAVQSLTAAGNGSAPYRYEQSKSDGQIEIANGTLSVNNLIDEMITRELTAEKPKVQFVMPRDYSFFYDTLFLKYSKSPALGVVCLFEFSKGADIVREKRNANLDIISALAPFIMHGGNFSAYYAYSAQPYGPAAMSPMPYFIVTSSCTATLTSDLQSAIAFRNPDVSVCYSGIFDSLKAKAKPLISHVTSTDETVSFYFSNMGSGAGIAGFGSHPCITLYYDRAVLEAHIPEDLPNREQFIEMSAAVCDGIQAMSKIHPPPLFFAPGGLDLFAGQGVIQTIDEKFFRPYAPAERADVLQRMIDDTQSDAVFHRIIDTSKVKTPARFYTDVFGGSHINMVIGDLTGDISTVNIYEGSVVDAFYDFLKNAVGTDIVYSKEDTLKTLKSALERVQALC